MGTGDGEDDSGAGDYDLSDAGSAGQARLRVLGHFALMRQDRLVLHNRHPSLLGLLRDEHSIIVDLPNCGARCEPQCADEISELGEDIHARGVPRTHGQLNPETPAFVVSQAPGREARFELQQTT